MIIYFYYIVWLDYGILEELGLVYFYKVVIRSYYLGGLMLVYCR